MSQKAPYLPGFLAVDSEDRKNSDSAENLEQKDSSESNLKDAISLSNAVTNRTPELIIEGDALQLPDADELKSQSTPEQSEMLNEVLRVAGTTAFADNADSEKAWQIARRKVERFKPLPWFLWRLSRSVFSKPVGAEEINEGMLLGLRRLVFAAASDPVLGSGSKINNLKKALEVLSPDTIAAVAIIHSVCKRLAAHGHETIWKSILDDALLSAQIGFELGKISLHAGKGRAMLAGFAVNIGLAVLIATGDAKQAQQTLEEISSGKDLKEVATNVYGCEPAHIASVLLASCGCGPDSAAGLMQSNLNINNLLDLKKSVYLWAITYKIVEQISKTKERDNLEEYFNLLGTDSNNIDQFLKNTNKIVRAGHSWEWIA